MIALWMGFASLAGGLFALAAFAWGRVARYLGWPTRFGWIVSIIVTVVFPLVVSRPKPSARSTRIATDVAVAPDAPLVGAPVIAPGNTPSPVATHIDAAPPAPSAASRPSSALANPRSHTASGGKTVEAPALAASRWPLSSDEVDIGLLLLWGVGSMVMAIRVLVTAWIVVRRAGGWRRLDLPALGHIPALVSPDTGPAVMGLLRPRVLLPEWVFELDTQSLAMMLAHEREHVRAGDPWLLSAGLLATVLMPWNPLLWFAFVRLRAAVEIDCDARVLRGDARPRAYANLLMTVGGRQSGLTEWSAAFSEPVSLLRTRIQRMTQRGPVHPGRAAAPFGALLLVATTVAATVPRPAPLRAGGILLDAMARLVRPSPPSIAWSIVPRSVAPVAAPVSAAPPHLATPAPVLAESIPRTRPIGARIGMATDSVPVSTHSGIRALSDGRVIVVDRAAKRIRLYEPGFTVSRDLDVLAAERWTGSVGVSPFGGDSTVVISTAPPVSATIIDPSGRVVRKLDWSSALLANPVALAEGVVTPSGNVVVNMRRNLTLGRNGGAGYVLKRADGTRTLDSTAIVRSSPTASGAMQYSGYVTIPVMEGDETSHYTDSAGFSFNVPPSHPIRATDAAAVFADGTVAIMRMTDYHIDWVNADGTMRSTPPIPHDWSPLTEQDKAALVDDWRALASAYPVSQSQPSNNGGLPYRLIAARVTPPNELPNQQAPFIVSLGGWLAYMPLADAEGHVWIPQPPRPGLGAHPGVIYDVVDRQGRLIDRVQMPPDVVPAAFGPGVLYAITALPSGPECPHPVSGMGVVSTTSCQRHFGRLTSYDIR